MRRHLLRYESKHQKVVPLKIFFHRMARNIGMAAVFVGFSLAIGMAGYHYFERLDWIDAFVNAAMILSGMGPLAQLHSDKGKLFAGAYALYSGLILIVAAGVILAPLMHRLLHRFHANDEVTS